VVAAGRQDRPAARRRGAARVIELTERYGDNAAVQIQAAVRFLPG
jgi:hypothetical protein